MEPRTAYRALIVKSGKTDSITKLENNPIDPSALKRKYQEQLRNDSIRTSLLSKYKKLAIEIYELSEQKRSENNSIKARKLKIEIDKIKQEITERESEIKKNTIVFAIVPSGYHPVENEDAQKISDMLRTKEKDEILTVNCEIIKGK